MGAGAGRSQSDLGWPRISLSSEHPLPSAAVAPGQYVPPLPPTAGAGTPMSAPAQWPPRHNSHTDWQGRPGRAAGCAGLAAGNYNVETPLIVYCVHTVSCVGEAPLLHSWMLGTS